MTLEARTAQLIAGDCIEVMATMPAESIDAICTDPPYGLEFMGREWDSFRVDERSARWASRSGSAGTFGESHLGGAILPSYTKRRTTSRCLTCGKRDAFRNPHACGELADWRTENVDRVPVEMRAFQHWCEVWATEAYRVAKPGAHLLAFGGTRTYHRLATAIEEAGWDVRDCLVWGYATGFPKSLNLPGGLGTALKPAWEPIVMARKPLTGSVAANVAEHGPGALNIDAARIPMSDADRATIATGGGYLRAGYERTEGVALEGSVDGSLNGRQGDAEANERGRWPANVMLTDPIFDGQWPDDVVGGTSEQSGGGTPARRNVGDDGRTTYGAGWHGTETGQTPADTSGAYSRFFLVPKADRAGREPTWEGRQATGIEREPGARANLHPTVKPLELMRHLVRLVTPPGGVVLDPFLGSGTTALACEHEGFGWIGIERDPDYLEIARARLIGNQRGFGL